MKKIFKSRIGFMAVSLLIGLALSLSLAPGVRADIIVDIYRIHHSFDGGGAPYSDLVGSFSTPDILFGTNTDWYWHPYDLPRFGAEITGKLYVAANGSYTFSMCSDDGSLLFIDGSLVIDNGGMHDEKTVNGTKYLTAGEHLFRIEFYEDAPPGNSGADRSAGLDLYLPNGVSYSTVPEPGTMLLLGSGLLGLAGIARRKFRKE